VLDFGVARIVAETLTLQGIPLGTPSWMAPEQTRGEPATTATDVWALGVLAFYTLTGKKFWRACARPDERGVMQEIADQPIPIASMRALELGAGERIPPGFDQWFAQCVARSPADRFVNATAAYRALAQSLSV
jgi:serine/threonine protein kinase